MEHHHIDQLPVVTGSGQNAGHVNDMVAMQIVYARKKPSDVRVGDVMGRPFPQLDHRAEIDDLYKLFRLGSAMVVVTDEGKACGVLTRFDITSHLRATIKSDIEETAGIPSGKDKESTKKAGVKG